MQHGNRTSRGFTLIELLTVIAIIGILAGLSAAGLSRALTSAKTATMKARMQNVSSLLHDYYAQNDTFPPAYGYIHVDIRDEDLDCLDDADPLNDETPRENPDCLNDEEPPAVVSSDPFEHFVLESYMSYLGQARNTDLYDPFSSSYDTDGDRQISYLEFLPAFDRDATATDDLYEDGSLGGGSNMDDEVTALLRADERPFIYLPVNKRQVQRVAAQWAADFPADTRPDDDTTINSVLQDLLANELGNQAVSEFPPLKYDAFVLMSVGPDENTFGMLSRISNMVDLANYPDEYKYHVLGIAAYFMATRDANDNNVLDFDYFARTGKEDTQYQLPQTLFYQGQPGFNYNPDTRRSGPVILVADE